MGVHCAVQGGRTNLVPVCTLTHPLHSTTHPPSHARPETQISLEAGSSVVRCDSGFKYGGEAEVLFEENFYNKKSQPYRVVCIDR